MPMRLCCRFTSAIAVILTILLTGCASHVPSTQATVPATAIAALSDRVIVPGERIGPVRLAGKIDEVVKLFGPGTVRKQGARELFVFQTWDAIGLWVQFDPGTGNIVWASVDTSGSNPWAEHSTPDGIRLGTRQQDMVSIMGAPERTVTGGGATSFYYDRRGIRFTVADNGPLEGKIGAMRVVWPSVPRGDTLIVPGKRISSIAVGAPVDRVLAILGGGYYKGESLPGFHVYYWPHLGLSLVEWSGRVISARAASHRAADAPGLRYATADGLGRGSTASEIRHTYGDPPETGKTLGWLSWIYRSRGISFALDNESRVLMIDVPPEGQ
jgi:hypothetical protein